MNGTQLEALAAGMNEEIIRQNVVLNAFVRRTAQLEAVIRKYHEWHLNSGGDPEDYLESGMYEAACAAVPGLAATGKN